MDLACYLLEKGVRADKPVGVHPYRQWCRQTDHQNTGKCPIHAAAERNQLLILKLFINKNLLSLGCRDHSGRDPLRIAVQHGHRECVRYLADKLCSVVSLVNTLMSVRIYLQVKRWVKLGKGKAAHSQRCYTSTAFKAKLGTTLLIDGFNHTQMSSELRREEKELKTRVAGEALKIITPINEILSISNPPYETSTSVLARRHGVKSEERRQRPFGRRRDDGVMEKERVSQCRDRFILPLIYTVKVPRQTLVGPSSGTLNIMKSSLDSSHQCNQTSRSKAVYFFTLASTFTKKPWMKQLKIAQTLLRRHNCLCHSQNSD
uniref:Uncharacterized protein n=2 Tax=Gouania willdenowi TaxID=441366 RepID=A0A8C5E8V5_GOUWI